MDEKARNQFRSVQTSILGRMNHQISNLRHLTRLLWLFTKDDFDTFVLPNTTFGLIIAFVEARHALSHLDNTTIATQVISRLPYTILFNWANLLVFDLANQRLPDSIQEDRINKPWRALPSSLVTSRQVSQAMLVAMPVVLAVSYSAGTFIETALLFVLTWMYNDLRGGDEHWLTRNLIIAAAFYLYNLGSAKVAAASLVSPGHLTTCWATIVSMIILTTMHVQDFKDQEGDATRGRRTAPIALGNTVARLTFASPLLFWSLGFFIIAAPGSLWYGLLVLGLGALVASRSLLLSGRSSDRQTWKLWCLWCAIVYGLPLAVFHRIDTFHWIVIATNSKHNCLPT